MIKMISILTAILTGLLCLGAAPARASEMSLTVFNVGKADCMLLQSGETAYLIDTARGKSWDDVEKWLRGMNVRHLDGVIITHMDSDHVGGLKKLLKSDLETDHLYFSAFFTPEKDEENPGVKTAKKQGREAEFLRGGEELPFDGGTLKIIGPLEQAKDKEDNNSLVLYAEAAGGSILLAGDMEFSEEDSLLKAGVVPRARVLKVGNHGDDDATSNALLSAVQPEVAVISTSTEEKASTPAQRVLEALTGWGTEIFQTQEAETGVRITFRDGTLTVEYQ